MQRLLIFLTFAVLLASIIASAQTIIPGGNVSGTWDLVGSPYLIEGEITLPSNNTLTIDPGVDVIFQGHYKFIVEGMLQAIGTEADSITFIAVASEGWHGLRFYDLNTQPDSSRLVYCVLEYGRASGLGNSKHGGAVYAADSDPIRISNCTLTNNRTGDVLGHNGPEGIEPGGDGGAGESVISGHGGAVYVHESSLLITNCVFSENRTGNATGGNGGDGSSEGGSGGDGGNGGNGTAGEGGVIYIQGSSPTIEYNHFSSNTTGQGRGGEGGEGGFGSTVGYQVAHGGDGGEGGEGFSGSGGVIYIASGTPQLVNNLVTMNNTGLAFGGAGGIGGDAWGFDLYGLGGDGGDGGNAYSGNGSAVITAGNIEIKNATVTNNYCHDAIAGEGGERGYNWYYGQPGENGEPGVATNGTGTLLTLRYGFIEMSSSILWANNLPSIQGNVSINYSCIQGGYPGIGNISFDPIFVSNPAGDYFLSQIEAGQWPQSHCVNAGDPDASLISGSTRTDGVLDSGIVDMGFHYLEAFPSPLLIVYPTALYYDALLGGDNPPPQLLSITNLGIGTFQFTATTSEDWIELSPVSGGPVPPINTIMVSVDITGLSFGDHSGSIVIEADSCAGSPVTIDVSLFIWQPILDVTPNSLAFTATINQGNPESQAAYVINAGWGELYYSTMENADWLDVNPDSGGPILPSAMETLTVSADIEGLPVGFYDGLLVVFAQGAQSSPDTILVTLVISEPVLFVQPTSFELYEPYGGDPEPQTVDILNSGTGEFYYNVVDTTSWFTVIPSSGGPVPPSRELTITFDTQSLPEGIYESAFTVYAESAYGSPVEVSVRLHRFNYLSGTISGILSAGDYYVIDDIFLLNADILQILPGARLLFHDDVCFYVEGYLQAEGSEGDSIYFINAFDSTQWGGIIGSGWDVPAVLDYCVIDGSRNSGFHAEEALLKHSRVSNNECGIDVQGDEMTIQHCLITCNSNPMYGAGINASYCDILTIEDTEISYNESCGEYGHGGGLYMFLGDAILRNCTFKGNIASDEGAAICCWQVDLVIDSCRFVDNVVEQSGGRGGGIFHGNTSTSGTCTVTNSEFISNYAQNGSAAFVEETVTTNWINNNFVENDGALPASSTLYLNPGYWAEIRNCIFHGNDNIGIHFNTASGCYVEYSCFFLNDSNFSLYAPVNIGILSQTNANGDSCDVYNNIFMDPLFYATSGDSAWRLTELSPCIDAGDPLSPFDPDSTIADMGAYYFYHELGIVTDRQIEIPDDFCLFPAYPNPFNPSTTIRFGLPAASEVSLAIYNIRGEKVADLVNGYRLAGYHDVTWDAGNLPSGVYFAQIQAGDYSSVQKLMLVK